MSNFVQPQVVNKWNKTYAAGSDKKYPNLDLVRLELWFFEKKPGKLLEYGFGCGVNMIHMLQRGYDIDALDASVEAKKLVEAKLAQRPDISARARLKIIGLDDERLPYEDNTFDYITCVSVLSLLGSQERMCRLLEEFKRVLKPGGKIIVDINGPQSDFARLGRRVGNDIYEYMGFKKNEDPVPCYCPADEKQFADDIARFFKIDDIGHSSHKLMHSEIQEFIICAHKA